MRNSVELEKLAHIFVFSVCEPVTGFSFQVLLYIVRVGLSRRFFFAGYIDELKIGMVAVLSAQIGCSLYASPAGATIDSPEVNEEYFAGMRSNDTAENIGSFPRRKLVGCCPSCRMNNGWTVCRAPQVP